MHPVLLLNSRDPKIYVDRVCFPNKQLYQLYIKLLGQSITIIFLWTRLKNEAAFSIWEIWHKRLFADPIEKIPISGYLCYLSMLIVTQAFSAALTIDPEPRACFVVVILPARYCYTFRRSGLSIKLIISILFRFLNYSSYMLQDKALRILKRKKKKKKNLNKEI